VSLRHLYSEERLGERAREKGKEGEEATKSETWGVDIVEKDNLAQGRNLLLFELLKTCGGAIDVTRLLKDCIEQKQRLGKEIE